jgi:hydroxymethylglutaryl-CoA lyase
MARRAVFIYEANDRIKKSAAQYSPGQNSFLSEVHNQAEMKKTTKESVKGLIACGKAAKECGIRIMGSISYPFISPWDGIIPIDTVKFIISSYRNAGVTEVSLSDTSGSGNPSIVYDRILELQKAFPDMSWMVHFHNTRGLGLANVLAAMQAGVTRIDSSFAGTGGCPYIKGAKGNIATEDLLFMLEGMGIETGVDFKKAIEIGKYVKALVKNIPTDSYQLDLAEAGEMLIL